MNLVVLQGRLTKEPIVRYTPDSQLAIASFSVAVDRGKNKNGEDMGADFIPVKVFGKQAENCERFLGKGCRVSVQGRIQTGSYEKDGQKVFTTDVIASRVEFIDFKDKTPHSERETPSETYQQESIGGFSQIPDSEIPF